ncbi:hypothetical protein SAICODRAFT_30619 [Saitoella complicata NRRL Y-17804]|uniref:uncharacterized protein n=1 Tax=Saitoella complicata (strain BCRC 22490 / CBS 7301 / JCM 7358 / NBRC 10748 / NRRL Y-17804) TaxID=698492 RepID=UPI0008679B7F|nr:uncharacterized protein SAICODRAFT_30619 [Saitoella complicata NRRL Y-17804]ODQ52445.1 hypothetical protein SAICODRAFT_30619 [Saitoella complicata NRRL Y-17804]
MSRRESFFPTLDSIGPAEVGDDSFFEGDYAQSEADTYYDDDEEMLDSDEDMLGDETVIYDPPTTQLPEEGRGVSFEAMAHMAETPRARRGPVQTFLVGNTPEVRRRTTYADNVFGVEMREVEKSTPQEFAVEELLEQAMEMQQPVEDDYLQDYEDEGEQAVGGGEVGDQTIKLMEEDLVELDLGDKFKALQLENAALNSKLTALESELASQRSRTTALRTDLAVATGSSPAPKTRMGPPATTPRRPLQRKVNMENTPRRLNTAGGDLGGADLLEKKMRGKLEEQEARIAKLEAENGKLQTIVTVATADPSLLSPPASPVPEIRDLEIDLDFKDGQVERLQDLVKFLDLESKFVGEDLRARVGKAQEEFERARSAWGRENERWESALAQKTAEIQALQHQIASTPAPAPAPTVDTTALDTLRTQAETAITELRTALAEERARVGRRDAQIYAMHKQKKELEAKVRQMEAQYAIWWRNMRDVVGEEGMLGMDSPKYES